MFNQYRHRDVPVYTEECAFHFDLAQVSEKQSAVFEKSTHSTEKKFQGRSSSSESTKTHTFNLLLKKSSRNNEKTMNGTGFIPDLKALNIGSGMQSRKAAQNGLGILDIECSISSSSHNTNNDTSQVRPVHFSQKDSLQLNQSQNFIHADQQLHFHHSKVVRDVSNPRRNDKLAQNMRLKNKTILKSNVLEQNNNSNNFGNNNNNVKNIRNQKLPLKDITHMILNNIKQSKSKATSQTKTYDCSINYQQKKKQQAQNYFQSENEPQVQPYGNPSVPQVKVQPKQLSESHNNSPRITSAIGSGRFKRQFNKIDRETDINFYQDILTQSSAVEEQQQPLFTHNSNQNNSNNKNKNFQSSFFLQPKVQRNAVQRQMIIDQNCNNVNMSTISQGENVKSIECPEAHALQINQGNLRQAQRQNQFKDRVLCKDKARGKSHNSPKNGTSLDRMLLSIKTQQKLKKFKFDRTKNEAKLSLQNNQQIVDSFFEKERLQFRSNCPLEGHQITMNYRTKMVDWMIEVCVSFKLEERTWFLAVSIFDKYLSLNKGIKVLHNSDVHSIGITSLYLASKYQDIQPINSFIAYEKIGHCAVPQADILRNESEFLRVFDFQLDLITPFDFHQYFMGGISQNMSDMHQDLYLKLNELSLYMLRMSLENIEFLRYEPSMLAAASIYSAISLLKRSNKFGKCMTHEQYKELAKDCLIITRMQYRIEQLDIAGKQMIQFLSLFDNWHCGLNQLKKFKPLSFTLK